MFCQNLQFYGLGGPILPKDDPEQIPQYSFENILSGLNWHIQKPIFGNNSERVEILYHCKNLNLMKYYLSLKVQHPLVVKVKTSSDS
jgi:hypothetical protein